MIFHTSMKVLCVCGRRLGLHRYGNDACPNPNWRPGTSDPEFLLTTFRPQNIELAKGADPFHERTA